MPPPMGPVGLALAAAASAPQTASPKTNLEIEMIGLLAHSSSTAVASRLRCRHVFHSRNPHLAV